MDSLSDCHSMLLYQAELEIDMSTYETNSTDPRVYNAKYIKKLADPDAPTFKEAMFGIEADK